MKENAVKIGDDWLWTSNATLDCLFHNKVMFLPIYDDLYKAANLP